MEEKVVKKIAPFTPLAKPLGPLDPMPVFRWEEKIEKAPEFQLKMERTPMPELPPDPIMDPIRKSRDRLYDDICRYLRKIEREMWNKWQRGEISKQELNEWLREWHAGERRDGMGNGMSLGMVMKLVDNTTPVRIDVMGEEMQLTPHRLALYAQYEVRKMFINCQAELEMELEDR